MKTCTIDGCDRKLNGHGLCSSHAYRMKKFGDPLHGGPLKERRKYRPVGLSLEETKKILYSRRKIIQYDGIDGEWKGIYHSTSC